MIVSEWQRVRDKRVFTDWWLARYAVSTGTECNVDLLRICPPTTRYYVWPAPGKAEEFKCVANFELKGNVYAYRIKMWLRRVCGF